MKYEFDVIVIGGGAAGLTASGLAANFGAKTLLVESEKLGGECTWTGCIPSKTLLKASRVAHQLQNASRYGLTDQKVDIDFKSVIEHVHKTRENVYEEADHPDIFRNMGVDVMKGAAEFLNDHTLLIEKEDGSKTEVNGRFIFIASGSKPFIPPIDGIEGIDYLTSESLFNINELPGQLIVAGAGPIGIEMAQAFNRLGAEVTVVEQLEHILPADNEELSDLLKKQLQDEGIRFSQPASLTKVERGNQGIRARIEYVDDGEQKEVRADQLLLATGSRPRVDDLKLENAGVSYSDEGVEVDDRCRTSQKHIYAVGDVTGDYPFTHMAEHMSKVAISNALLKWPKTVDKEHVTWCTYTDPELAHIGASEKELKHRGDKYEVYRFPFDKMDRAITDNETAGLIKVFARSWDGKIRGVTILGSHAGEMISEFALAMKHGITLRQISNTIHPYPTYGLGNRRAADQWYVGKQSEWSVKLLQKMFGYRGEIPDLSDPDRIV